MHKNIQIIDGARNSTFDIYQIEHDIFELVFPEQTDVAFVDEVDQRVKQLGKNIVTFWGLVYQVKVKKKDLAGIHGTLHLSGSYCKKELFPGRKESEVIIGASAIDLCSGQVF